MSSKHQEFLRTHCRVCSKVLGKTKYNCCKYLSLLEHLGVNPTHDSSDVHPDSFCNGCYLIAKNISDSGEKTFTQTPIEWLPHDDTLCFVCDVRCKGGRPKQKHPRGRSSHIQQHIKSIAAKLIPHFSLSQLADERYKDDVTSSSCGLAANNPIEILSCKILLCSSCCISLATQPSFSCPGCSCHHDSTASTFTRPSCIVEKMFNEMTVTCKKCKCQVKLESIGKACVCHQQSHHLPLKEANQSQVTPTNIDKQEAVKVVSRMLRESESGTLTVPTGGRVSLLCTLENVFLNVTVNITAISIMKVTNSSVPSGEASRDTKRCRSQELATIRDKVSVGGGEQQIVDEVKLLPKELREVLMKEMNFIVYIPPEQNLAMKADLCLPWNKLRIMHRYTYGTASSYTKNKIN